MAYKPKPTEKVMNVGLSRINAYTTPNPGGQSVRVDVEGMLVDMVSVLKASGQSKLIFMETASRVWDDVEVTVTMPKKDVN